MDSYDRLRWLQERCRFEQALEVAERDPTLKPASRAEVSLPHQALFFRQRNTMVM